MRTTLRSNFLHGERGHWRLTGICLLVLWANPVAAQRDDSIRIVEIHQPVEILAPGAVDWTLAATNQILHSHYRMRIGANGSVGVLWSDHSVIRFSALTELEIMPPATSQSEHGLKLVEGILSFFHRGQPGRINIITSGALAGIKGTEFVLQAGFSNGVPQTTLSVIDGIVGLTNQVTNVVVSSGQQVVAQWDQPPARTVGFIAHNILQWCFYYPGVLDPKELSLSTNEADRLSNSLRSYREGDLVAALAKFPANYQGTSSSARIYHAALLLGVGEVEETEKDLAAVSREGGSERNSRLAAALEVLIDAVKHSRLQAGPRSDLATECLAASYWEQSEARVNVSLHNALDLAQMAVRKSPEFGYGWERLAELEFSFGHTERSIAALDRALQLSPRNAQALALKGFLLAAEDHTRAAKIWFDRALEVNAALGNAWLGRGLCRIRGGDSRGGLEDLLIAAAMEPQRSLLRSYLAKAWSDTGQDPLAHKELHLAKVLDPSDPTPWLYSALLNEQENRINDAIRDLEESQDLNTNRSVYRSATLLDQDRGVRSANLARIYGEAGMPDEAFREAVNAVNSDYLNYSAHLFLANSYSQLEDPNLVNLRYEPAETTEYLLANFLAPAAAGTLSPTISQQEYSRLFEQDGTHLTSTTEYLSRGEFVESAAQFGLFGDFSYSLETHYRTDPGQRMNDALDETSTSALIKEQITPVDTINLQVNWLNVTEGDLAQRYDPNVVDLSFRGKENQDGSLLMGYHHTWGPGMDTLVLAGRVPDRYSFFTQNGGETQTFDLTAPEANVINIAENYQANLTLYLGELQQLMKFNDAQETILGVKFAYGELNVSDSQYATPSFIRSYFTNPSVALSLQDSELSVERLDFYLYHRWQIIDGLWLQGGISYDRVELPEDFLYGPVTTQEVPKNQVSPKAGFVWNPLRDTTVRFAYLRSLTGVTFEQSLSLEPSQVAGFTQAYRDIIPEAAVGGPSPAEPFDLFGFDLDQKFSTGTYLGMTLQMIDSAFDRSLGGYNLNYNPQSIEYSLGSLSSGREHMNYCEETLTFTANQLVERDLSLGLRYQATLTKLSQQITEDENPVITLNNGLFTTKSTLHQVDLSATLNHPSGFFAQVDGLWSLQSNSGFNPDEPGDEFWQVNFLAGYRFPRQQAQVSAGIINLTDRDYRLEPLTFYNELARRRTFVTQLTFNF